MQRHAHAWRLTFMKHQPVTQIVIRRAITSSCVRWPRAASPDQALAQLIALHTPKGF